MSPNKITRQGRNGHHVFIACRLRDYPVLVVAVRQFYALWPDPVIVVACPPSDIDAIRFGLPMCVSVIDEKTVTPDIDIEAFKSAAIPLFPKSFGWYYQQILKINYARVTRSDEYLVWDADTIPLSRMYFRDSENRILLTTSKEYHPPYFYTFRHLLGMEPVAPQSLVSQHMLVDSSMMCEMLSFIEDKHVVNNWVEALGRVLERHPDTRNLFSEYETYGNYLLNAYPGQSRWIERRWRRISNRKTWGVDHTIIKMASKTGECFLALESKDHIISRSFLKSLERCNSAVIKRLAVRFCRS